MEKQSVLSPFSLGFSEGYAVANTRNAHLEQQMFQLLRELRETKQDLLMEAASDIRTVVQDICWNILRKHLLIHPEDVAEVVAECLKSRGARQLVIAMHPDFAERAKAYLDPALCKLEMDRTIVPGDFEVHMEETKHTLASIIGVQTSGT